MLFCVATCYGNRCGVWRPCLALAGAPIRRMLLAPGEASRLLAAVAEAHRLAVSLLNGAGLRLMECLTLRLKDVDLARRRIHVRDGKGGKGRFTMPPEA